MVKLFEIAVKVIATGVALMGFLYFTLVALILWDVEYFTIAVELVDKIWED